MTDRDHSPQPVARCAAVERNAAHIEPGVCAASHHANSPFRATWGAVVAAPGVCVEEVEQVIRERPAAKHAGDPECARKHDGLLHASEPWPFQEASHTSLLAA